MTNPLHFATSLQSNEQAETQAQEMSREDITKIEADLSDIDLYL